MDAAAAAAARAAAAAALELDSIPPGIKSISNELRPAFEWGWLKEIVVTESSRSSSFGGVGGN